MADDDACICELGTDTHQYLEKQLDLGDVFKAFLGGWWVASGPHIFSAVEMDAKR